ncbi:hypothetical protein DPMN_133634 [Dreissena polymorpha]|uniref:C1q domain-containing protein n=1 Tax=Dreissena polymorpha TaxID=45954 RepID=A0A9D4FXE3_DREPO|nr:hypothetical protein DPMN_133634 [Dreissena polymorpha]
MEKKQMEMETRLSDFINNTSNNMNSTLAANVVSMVKAASDIKANASVTVQQLVNEVRILKDQLKVPTINFRARITTSSTEVSSGQDVVFPTVDANEGQGYASSTGKFTAFISGMYLFSVQYCVSGKQNGYLEIAHQGEPLQKSAHHDSANEYPCLTMLVSTPLSIGHQVGCGPHQRARCMYLHIDIRHFLAH